MRKLNYLRFSILLILLSCVIVIFHKPVMAALPTITLASYRPDCGQVRSFHAQTDFYTSQEGNPKGHPCLDRFAGKDFWAYMPPAQTDYQIAITPDQLAQCTGRIFAKKYNYTNGLHTSLQQLTSSQVGAGDFSPSLFGQTYAISPYNDPNCNLVELTDNEAFYWRTHTRQLCSVNQIEIVCESNAGSNTTPSVGPGVNPPGIPGNPSQGGGAQLPPGFNPIPEALPTHCGISSILNMGWINTGSRPGNSTSYYASPGGYSLPVIYTAVTGSSLNNQGGIGTGNSGYNSSLGMSNVITAVQNGHPVILATQFPGQPGTNHYVVAIGYNSSNNTLTIINPNVGQSSITTVSVPWLQSHPHHQDDSWYGYDSNLPH